MAYTRYNGNVVPFAKDSTTTNRTVFGSTTQSDNINDNLNDNFKLGWQVVPSGDNPPKQWFNAFGYTATNLIAYLYQSGVPEWNALQEYTLNSYVQGSDGIIYKSLVSSNVGNNITDASKWRSIHSIFNLDIDGATDIGADLSDGDLIIVDDGANGTNRKSAISRIWTYISGKLTGAISTVTTSNLTTNRALSSDASGKIGVSTVTSTELGYLSGVTSGIQTQINGKAPTASPTFTGDPKSVTPAQFDNDTSIATTAFVQRALGNRSAAYIFTSSQNIGAAHAGSQIQYTGTANATFTLPAAYTLPGANFEIWNNSDYVLTLTNTPTWFYGPQAGTGFGSTTTTVTSFATVNITSDGFNWIATSGTNRSAYVYSTGQTLTAKHVGSFVQYNGTGIATFAMPTPVNRAGLAIDFWNNSASQVTLTTPAGSFYGPSGNSGIVLPGNSVTAISDGFNWILTSGGGQALLSGNGYQKLPSGLIIQWGSYSISASSTGSVNFPIAFLNACTAITLTRTASTANYQFYEEYLTSKSTSGFSWWTYAPNYGISVNYIAIGY